jgi:hypothetical protein
MYFVFCRLYPCSSQPPNGSVWVLPVLSNTVLPPVRACITILWERFRGTPKKDDRGPPSIQSSLVSYLNVCNSFGFFFINICGTNMQMPINLSPKYLCNSFPFPPHLHKYFTMKVVSSLCSTRYMK